MGKCMIVSWCDADDVMNYGQILQGCAMMVLINKVYEGEVKYISYLPRGPRGILQYYLKHLNPFNGHLVSHYYTKKIINQFKENNNIKLIQVSDKKTINKISKDIDIFICGSDQIWHPQNFDPVYFLQIGDKNAKRVSYAASLPKSHIEVQYTNEYKLISECLNKLDYISVREKESVKFITELSNKDVEFVLDPTYLIDKKVWLQLCNKKNDCADYIFVYVPNGIDEKMVKRLLEIKKSLKIDKIYILSTRGYVPEKLGKVLKYVSIGEFLSLIKNSKLVYTSSFHAVVFATIFEKEFLCCDVLNEYRGEDLRLSSLLSILDIKERLINNEFDYSKMNLIDYENVRNRINIYKDKSMAFISKCISNKVI